MPGVACSVVEYLAVWSTVFQNECGGAVTKHHFCEGLGIASPRTVDDVILDASKLILDLFVIQSYNLAGMGRISKIQTCQWIHH